MDNIENTESENLNLEDTNIDSSDINAENAQDTALIPQEDIEDDIVQTNLSNMDMMTKIAKDKQTLEDIKGLTSSKVTDQLKVFLISQARNELMRVVKLTQFLDNLENKFMDKVNDSITDDSLTLKQYTDVLTVITQLLTRANDTISRVLRDDSLMTILNTTIYNTDSSVQSTSVIANLKDPQSRERVRSIINLVLQNTANYQESSNDSNIVTVEDGGDKNEV